MLAPDQRTLMLDALRPPDGYTFDRGVGTSFTLNLMTLLVAPLSLALHDVASAEEAIADPVLLLDGVRHYADRLVLFSQAGYIAIPKQANHLFPFLEEMVVEVRAPNGGLFHPKIWLLRYTRDDTNPFYRFLCLSRNVDFSNSWDIVLRLDGELMDRKVGYSRNKPLADFIEALPRFGIRPQKKRIREIIQLLQDEVRRVDFRVPKPFFEGDLEFIALGDRKHLRQRLDFGKRRSMVVSPFLSEEILKEATHGGDDHILFSEAESLKRISPETLSRFDDIFIFNDASINIPVDDAALDDDKLRVAGGFQGDQARLHAKLFIFEEGWDAKWWVGSANATWPALNGNNVEFLVGLKGRKSQVGIDKVLGDEGDKLSLRTMLAQYEPDQVEKTKPDEAAVRRLLESIRKNIVSRQFHLLAKADEEGEYELHLRSKENTNAPPEGDYFIRSWPVTIRERRAQSIDLDKNQSEIIFSDLNLLQLTSFIAFHIEAKVGRSKQPIRFVMNLPVSGFPRQRDDHIISAILSDTTQFLRYLRFILAEELGWLEVGGKRGGSFWGKDGRWVEGYDDQIPLLEDLVRAFSRSPEKIDQVTEIVDRLSATQEGRKVLPEGFEQLWQAIREAREGTT